jgi:hypothetical protein
MVCLGGFGSLPVPRSCRQKNLFFPLPWVLRYEFDHCVVTNFIRTYCIDVLFLLICDCDGSESDDIFADRNSVLLTDTTLAPFFVML